MAERTTQVPYHLIERFSNYFSADKINVDEPKKSHARVFRWRQADWTCVGGCSSGGMYEYIKIIKVVPTTEYNGRKADPKRRGHGYYTGATFLTSKGESYTLTHQRVTLRRKPGISLGNDNH